MLDNEKNDLIALAYREIVLFETGEELELESEFKRLTKIYGSQVIDFIENIIDSNQVNTTITGEFLRQIGSIENNDFLESQLRILKKFLSHKSPRVRDGAIMGLSYLKSDQVIPILDSAILTESDQFLLKVIQKILNRRQNKKDL